MAGAPLGGEVFGGRSFRPPWGGGGYGKLGMPACATEGKGRSSLPRKEGNLRGPLEGMTPEKGEEYGGKSRGW